MKYDEAYVDKVIHLAKHIVSSWDPKMKWMWGEALLGYALDELDQVNGTSCFTKFLTDYCDYWASVNPAVDQSDTAAPGLIAYAMYKKTQKEEYKRLTEKVLNYIQNEPRLYQDCLNHLGSSTKSKLYPKSVWIDSVMMFSVFTSLYAKENHDADLLEFAARQPRQYAQMMFDKTDHLWSHSFWVKQKKPFPEKIYWARGNGWVICGFPMILDNIGLDHPEAKKIVEIFQKTSEALLKCMNQDGTFNTLLNHKSYRELSATALIAAGWMHGVRCGYLDSKFLKPALHAFHACTDAIQVNQNEVIFPEISGPTIPLPVFPKLGYLLILKGSNWSYGIAALIFAAVEYKKLYSL